jgi:hypothetical protein
MAAQKVPDPEIHALALAEVRRQTAEYNQRRQKIAAELASLFAARKAGAPVEQPLPDHVLAARSRAKELLNGHAPASLTLPPAVTREQELNVERDAIDIVLRILSQSEIAARAAAAVEWVAAHAAEWKGIAREIVLHALRLQALEQRLERLGAEAPDFAQGLPLTQHIGFGRFSLLAWNGEDPLRELRADALAEGVVTPIDVRKAQDVG